MKYGQYVEKTTYCAVIGSVINYSLNLNIATYHLNYYDNLELSFEILLSRLI